jgi:transcriptional regulator with XRE-family HTH domain
MGSVRTLSVAFLVKGVPMPVLRQVVGDTLRALRLRQRRTLREVSASARVSLGYLSEVERGQKEPSSELLAAICGALDVELSELFAEVSQTLRREEKLALGNRVALVGTPAPRIATAPTTGSGPTAQLRTVVAA